LDVRERHLFHLAAYDLDAFRRQAVENDLLKDLASLPHGPAVADIDDETLLRFSLDWLKRTLFLQAGGGTS
ncbi:MAG: YkgJ family cysteine cluster protein, partial [Desulfococcus multivorans]|nr:YkgJ family cysteine cluster protein [Desulfococcus multivorans]